MKGLVGVPSLVPVRVAPRECQSDGDITGLDWTAQEEAERHVTEVDAQLPPSFKDGHLEDTGVSNPNR